MRRRVRSSTIWIVFIHPSILLEFARQRQRELVADAERGRLIKRALDKAGEPGESERLSPDVSQSDGAPAVPHVGREAA